MKSLALLLAATVLITCSTLTASQGCDIIGSSDTVSVPDLVVDSPDKITLKEIKDNGPKRQTDPVKAEKGHEGRVRRRLQECTVIPETVATVYLPAVYSANAGAKPVALYGDVIADQSVSEPSQLAASPLFKPRDEDPDQYSLQYPDFEADGTVFQAVDPVSWYLRSEDGQHFLCVALGLAAGSGPSGHTSSSANADDSFNMDIYTGDPDPEDPEESEFEVSQAPEATVVKSFAAPAPSTLEGGPISAPPLASMRAADFSSPSMAPAPAPAQPHKRHKKPKKNPRRKRNKQKARITQHPGQSGRPAEVRIQPEGKQQANVNSAQLNYQGSRVSKFSFGNIKIIENAVSNVKMLCAGA